MSLRGNLNSVDLANIFQMLSINQKEGTLNIFDGDSKKSIYFSREGVSMLSRGKGMDTLGRILLRYDRVTEGELERALDMSRQSGKLLGAVLVDNSFLPKEAVDDALRIQIEEEIYNLFIWKDASFEFIEGAPPREFEEVDGGVTRLTFNVNSLIMEAARRIDEWDSIQEMISSTREIYRYSGRNMELTDDIFREPYCEKVLAAINGKYDVDEIIESSFVNRFEVCKILMLLLEQNAIEPVPTTDLAQNAEAAISRGEVREGIKFLERILELGGDTPETHRSLGEAYETLKEIRKAAEHYRTDAECRLTAGEAEEAFDIYQRICELLPTDLSSPERMIEIFVDHAEALQGKTNEIIERGKGLATIFVELKKMKRAVQTLHRIIALAPEDFSLRHLLINIYLANGMPAEAVAEYEAMAAWHTKRRDWDQVIKILRKILVIDRTRDDVAQRLEQLIARKEKKKKGVRRLIGLAILVIALGVLGYGYVDYELEAREAIRQAEENVHAVVNEQSARSEPVLQTLKELRSIILTGKDRVENERLSNALGKLEEVRVEFEREIRAALHSLEEVGKRYRYTTAHKQAVLRQDDLRQKLQDFDGVRAFARDELQRRAVKLAEFGTQKLNDGRVSEALAAYEEAFRIAPDRTGLEELGVEKNIRSLTRTLRSFETSLGRIEELCSSGEEARAREIALRLVQDFTSISEVLERVPIPVRVETLPEGAEIWVNDEDTGIRSPGWFTWHPAQATRVSIRLRGFEREDVAIAKLDTDHRNEELRRIGELTLIRREFRKEVDWTASVSGAVEAAPTRHGNSAFLATRNGLVYRVDTADRQSQLIYDAKDVSLSGYGASPAVADGHIYLAMVEGKLQRVSLETKEPVWSKPLKGQVYAPLTLSGNILLVGENEGRLSAWDAPSGELLWEQRLPGEILNRPVVAGKTVLVTTVNGFVAAFDLSGDRLWEFQPGGETALGTPLVANGRVHLVSAEGDVHVYDLSDRKKLWGFEVNSEIRADPVLLGDLLLVGALDGNLYAVREGRLVDKLDVGAAITCTPAVDGNRVFLLDDAGRISRASIEDDAFKLKWRYELLSESGKPMRLKVAPVIIDDMVLVASESGELSILRD